MRQPVQKWNKANDKVLAGLTRRRSWRKPAVQGIPDADYDGKPDKPMPPMPQAVDEPEIKNARQQRRPLHYHALRRHRLRRCWRGFSCRDGLSVVNTRQ